VRTLSPTTPAPAAERARAPRRAQRLGRVLCWLAPAVLTGLLASYRMAQPEPWLQIPFLKDTLHFTVSSS